MVNNYLAGDVGGTKTILALYSPEAGPDKPFNRTVFSSREFNSLEGILREYLLDKKVTIHGASFGVAGPVIDDRVQATNLPWVVDANQLSANLGDAPVWLSNDLIATARTVPHLTVQDIHTLKSGEPEMNGAIGVVAPGTGLGEAFLTWNGASYSEHPSEGGHSNFGPATPQEIELLSYLQPELGHVSYENVCSGMGIPYLYAFFRDIQKLHEPDWLQNTISNSADPVPIIARAALERKSEICLQTMELFIQILANEAGNLALNIVATGGIYLGGGIPPRILPLIDKDTFRSAFVNKGRFEKLLGEIPVYVILKPDAALYGAACHIFEMVDQL
jgi:glucokinase